MSKVAYSEMDHFTATDLAAILICLDDHIEMSLKLAKEGLPKFQNMSRDRAIRLQTIRKKVYDVLKQKL